MMLGRDDDALHARSLGRGGPLAAVQGGGMENIFRLTPLPPFQAGEGVGSKVDEHVVFHFLPAQLRFRRYRTIRLGLAAE